MKIIKEEKLDDNNLIQYKYDEDNNKVLLVVRFDSNTIQEQTLTTMTLDEYVSELDRLVKINVNNTAIALFKKEIHGYAFNEYTLHDCYNLKEHSFSSDESLKLDYKKYFPNNKTDKYFVANKKK